MESDAVIVLIDEGCHVPMYMLKITIRIRVDFLPLERLHEALATGIVVGVRRPAHAREHLMLPEQLHVGPGGILGGFKWSLQHILCWPIRASGQAPLQAFSNSAFYEAWH